MKFELVKTAYAQALTSDVASLIKKINKVIINPLIIFIFSLALIYFIYGLVQFIANGGNEESRSEGKQHMIWGVIGMFIMISVFTIMQILLNTFGVRGVDINTGEVNLQ